MHLESPRRVQDGTPPAVASSRLRLLGTACVEEVVLARHEDGGEKERVAAAARPGPTWRAATAQGAARRGKEVGGLGVTVGAGAAPPDAAQHIPSWLEMPHHRALGELTAVRERVRAQTAPAGAKMAVNLPQGTRMAPKDAVLPPRPPTVAQRAGLKAQAADLRRQIARLEKAKDRVLKTAGR